MNKLYKISKIILGMPKKEILELKDKMVRAQFYNQDLNFIKDLDLTGEMILDLISIINNPKILYLLANHKAIPSEKLIRFIKENSDKEALDLFLSYREDLNKYPYLYNKLKSSEEARKVIAEREDLINYPEFYESLVNDFWPNIRIQMAKRTDLINFPEFYRKLANSKSEEILKEIAKREDLINYPDIILKLVKKENSFLQSIIAKRNDIQQLKIYPELVEIFVKSPSRIVRKGIASNTYSLKNYPELLKLLLQDSDPSIVDATIRNQKIDEETLLQILKKHSYGTLAILNSVSLTKNLLIYFAKNEKKKDILEKVLENEKIDQDIISTLLDNNNFPLILKEDLAKNYFLSDQNIKKLISDPSINWVTKVNLFKNQNFILNEEILDLLFQQANQKHDEMFLIELAKYPNLPNSIINKLIEFRNDDLNQTLAQIPNLTEEQLLKLTRGSKKTRIEIANRLNLPLKILEILARDWQDEVRLTLVRKNNLPEKIINILLQDPNPAIREYLRPYKINLNLIENENDNLSIEHRNFFSPEIFNLINLNLNKPIFRLPKNLKDALETYLKEIDPNLNLLEVLDLNPEFKKIYDETNRFYSLHQKKFKYFNYSVIHDKKRHQRPKIYYNERNLPKNIKHGRISILNNFFPNELLKFFDLHFHRYMNFFGWIAWIENNINEIEEPVFQIWEIQSDFAQKTSRLSPNFYKKNLDKPLLNPDGSIIEENFKPDNTSKFKNKEEVEKLFKLLKKYNLTKSKIDNLIKDWPLIFINEALRQAKKLGYSFVTIENLSSRKKGLSYIYEKINNNYSITHISGTTFNHLSSGDLLLINLNELPKTKIAGDLIMFNIKFLLLKIVSNLKNELNFIPMGKDFLESKIKTPGGIEFEFTIEKWKSNQYKLIVRDNIFKSPIYISSGGYEGQYSTDHDINNAKFFTSIQEAKNAAKWYYQDQLNQE